MLTQHLFYLRLNSTVQEMYLQPVAWPRQAVVMGSGEAIAPILTKDGPRVS